jgi:hypothetical protein
LCDGLSAYLFWLCVALPLAGLGAAWDIRNRTVPNLLLLVGFVLVVARWSALGIGWCVACFIIAWLVSKLKDSKIGEGDIAYYGILGGLIALPVGIMFLIATSLLVALCLTVYPSFRRSMPFVLALFLSVAVMLVIGFA